MERTESTKTALYFLSDRPVVGLAVDASCIGDPSSKQRGYFYGAIEWRCVDMQTGEEVFRSKIHEQGTVNIAEVMAVVDGLRWLWNNNDDTTPVYTDSITAMAWLRKGKHKCKLPHNDKTAELWIVFEEGLRWYRDFKPQNPIIKWDTGLFGDVPADFGRKGPKKEANPCTDCTTLNCRYPNC